MSDSFGIVMYGGIARVEYDLSQAQEDGFVKYDVYGPSDDRHWEYETDELDIGNRISIAVAEDVAEKLYMPPEGWVAHDSQLGVFSSAMDEPVHRERGCCHSKI
jgi:hypothetical protein